jgi:Spy/CpxP family protein refolding chaperone
MLFCAVVAALLLAPGSVARAAELCETTQQRPGQAVPAQPGGGDKRANDKGGRGGHPPSKWWVDAKSRTELGITDQQSAAVEQIWQKSVPALREAREKLDKLEAELTELTGSKAADEAQVTALIEKVENTRAEANKRRTLMIYRMHKFLTPEQREKVKAMFERRDAPRRGGSTSR